MKIRETIHYHNTTIVLGRARGKDIIITTYNTGDQVWQERPSHPDPNGYFFPDQPTFQVVKVKTHDGIYWEQGRKLESANWLKRMWQRYATTDIIAFTILVISVICLLISNC